MSLQNRSDEAGACTESKKELEQSSTPTNVQIKQFQIVRTMLAYLYHYTKQQRSYLNDVEHYKQICEQPWSMEELNKIHFGIMLLIMQLLHNNDLHLANVPKIPDNYFLQLMNHDMFNGKNPETFIKDVHLLGRYKEKLKELAIRIS